MLKLSRKTRIMALLLALVMLVSLVPDLLPDFLSTEAEAIYHENNAPAASLELLNTTADNFAATTGGAMLRTVDGDLYVWGKNTDYGLGLENDLDGVPATANTVVPKPTKHDFDFGGKIVKIFTSCNSGVSVLTEHGRLFSWGRPFATYVTNFGSGKTPTEWDLSAVTGTLVDVYSSSLSITAMDDQGNWYAAGSYSGLTKLGLPGGMAIAPIPETFIDKLQDSYDSTYVPDADAGEDISYKVRVENERAGGDSRRTIKKLLPSYGGHIFFTFARGPLDTEDIVYVTGTNNHGQGFLPDKRNASGDLSGYGSADLPVSIFASDVTDNADLVEAGPRLETLTTSGHVSAIIDESGSVWVVGSARYNDGAAGPVNFNLDYAFVETGENFRRPHKVYDAQLYGSKCIKVYLSSSVAVFLTEDNSLYAIGANANQFITTDAESTVNVHTATQIFAELSETETITGVYPTDVGVMVVSKSGDQFWSGDNSGGTAGNGTTDSPAPGKVEQAIPPELPPVQPLTANEIIFEIETADGIRYRYDADHDPSGTASKGGCITMIDQNGKVTSPWKTEDGKSLRGSIPINAGSIFKLNVYFNDFGRLNYFEVPIRFDPTYVQVVRGDGTAYAKNAPVSPGSLGANVGIVKQFTNSQWLGGTMVGEQVKQGGYPKIHNGEGWVSVAGYTAEKSARINGEVKMFSIYFTAVESMLSATDFFTIANDHNMKVPAVGSDGVGYDKAMTADDFGAIWGVSSLLENGKLGKFSFTYPKNREGNMLSPAFKTSVTWVTAMSLALKSADGKALEATKFDFPNTETKTTPITAPQLSYNNKTAIYTVEAQISPNASTPNSPPASFPEVNWSCAMYMVPDADHDSVDWDGTGDSGDPEGGSSKLTYQDFITIVSSNTSQLKFRISENYPAGMPSVIKFTAETQKEQGTGSSRQKIKRELLVVFRSFDPPKTIRILEHDDLIDDTALWTDINTVLPGEPERTFHADFPSEVQGFKQTAVVWTLMDKDRNVLTGLASDAAKLGTPADANSDGYMVKPHPNTNYEGPSVTVDLQHTTFGDDYLILRAESAYDGSVYDEIFLKIHQRVTSITWKKDKLYMLEDGPVVDLNTMITIGPEGEYYEANLEFTNELHPDNEGGTSSIYVVGTTGKMQALSLTAKDAAGFLFERVIVTDKISGRSTKDNDASLTPQYLQVAVISVESPIGAEDVEVHNLLGTKADYATVYNLKVGDSLVFFDDYPSASALGVGYNTELPDLAEKLKEYKTSGHNYKRFNNLTKEQLGAQMLYDFPLPDFLDGQGGDIGVMILRKVNDDDANQTVFDIMPVHYISDPSKVYGYVQLMGKEPNSYQNQGISVKLVGPSAPATITTGANGYFVFQEYIIPGEYTMVLSKDSYLTRTIQPNAATGYRGIVISEALEFAISTYENPIYLYPGDLDNNGSINASDISNYVRNWYGQTSYMSIYDFAKYDFYDLDGRNAINMYDLDAVVTHNGWTKTSYAKWNVPKVS